MLMDGVQQAVRETALKLRKQDRVRRTVSAPKWESKL